VLDVLATPGVKVVDTQDFISRLEETVAKVRTEKASSAGNENAVSQLCAFRLNGT
jgi:hypothetical protein